ncbi:hypothetical protein Tco_0153772 [Tanacetum coccineum]
MPHLQPYHQATLLTPIQKRIRRTWRRILLTILPMEEIILDNESSDDDNDDDDIEKDEEDEEEEEHLAPADPSTVPTDDLAGITEFAATLPSSSPPPENVESLKDNIRV